jgi:large subunit ribosomal protein L23
MPSTYPDNIILGPIVTEKTLAAQSVGEYYFWVNPTSNKNQIAAVFKAVFAVDPISVRTIRTKGKVKTDWKKRLPFQKSDRKKAIVKVAKDKKIEILSLNTK